VLVAESRFPVDPANPGEVFACLGMLEIAEVLWPGSAGGFLWSRGEGSAFILCCPGEGQDPVEGVLQFVVEAECCRCAPPGHVPSAAARTSRRGRTGGGEALPLCVRDTFPAPEEAAVDPKTLPVELARGDARFLLSCWCDGSSREPFKLFAGQQQAPVIVRQMRDLVRDLWRAQREQLLRQPLSLCVPLGGGSFKLDARKAWTAMDAGYSPDAHGDSVAASPVVELLGVAGLENARPQPVDRAAQVFRYGVWAGPAEAPLARAALAGLPVGPRRRLFRYTLQRSGQNKVVPFAEEDGET
jgi:CRISPR-associated protein Csb3